MKAMLVPAWIVALAMTAQLSEASEQATGPEFTYQGQLKLDGAPINGTADFQFSLWDAAAGGNQIGSLYLVGNKRVVHGLLTVVLNFGPDAFNGDTRWLQIATRSPAGSGSFATLTPRQLLTGVPYALHALNGGGFSLPYAGSVLEDGGFAFDVTNTGAAGSGITGQTHGELAYAIFGQAWGNNSVGVHGVAWNGTSYGGLFSAINDAYDLVLGGPLGQINSDLANGSSSLVLSSNLSVLVRLDNDGGEDGRFRILDSGGNDVCTVDEAGTLTAEALEINGPLYAHNGSGLATVVVDGDANGTGGLVALRSASAATLAQLHPNTAGGGELILANSGGAGKIYLSATESTGNAARMLMFNNAGTRTFDLDADRGDGDCGLYMRDNDGTITVELHSGEGSMGGNTHGGLMVFRTASGAETVRIEAETGHTTTKILSITGGSDLSEQFEIAGQDGGKVEPGMVVCIDADHPGKLTVSSKAYDRTVAGVISGAGGIRPGMLMGQRGSPADGANPVALTGRVYCRVDATNGPVRPGDLLTTSPVPGHAMKSTDHMRAAGSILGKAMTGLEQGERGLVLILVSLQ